MKDEMIYRTADADKMARNLQIVRRFFLEFKIDTFDYKYLPTIGVYELRVKFFPYVSENYEEHSRIVNAFNAVDKE